SRPTPPARPTPTPRIRGFPAFLPTPPPRKTPPRLRPPRHSDGAPERGRPRSSPRCPIPRAARAPAPRAPLLPPRACRRETPISLRACAPAPAGRSKSAARAGEFPPPLASLGGLNRVDHGFGAVDAMKQFPSLDAHDRLFHHPRSCRRLHAEVSVKIRKVRQQATAEVHGSGAVKLASKHLAAGGIHLQAPRHAAQNAGQPRQRPSRGGGGEAQFDPARLARLAGPIEASGKTRQGPYLAAQIQ